MNLFGPKRWAIGDHRVQKARVQTGTKTVLKSNGDPTCGGSTYREEKPTYSEGYKCVDCEKKSTDREKFKDEVCYEVI